MPVSDLRPGHRKLGNAGTCDVVVSQCVVVLLQSEAIRRYQCCTKEARGVR